MVGSLPSIHVDLSSIPTTSKTGREVQVFGSDLQYTVVGNDVVCAVIGKYRLSLPRLVKEEPGVVERSAPCLSKPSFTLTMCFCGQNY